MAAPRCDEIPHSCNEEDGDPAKCVQCLINTHSSKIVELREAVKGHIADEEHDDLWLLRYILSFKEVKSAVEPIQRATQWRRDNAKLVDLVRNGGEHPPHYETINRYVATELHKTKRDGGPVYVIRSGLSNPKFLMDTVSYEEMMDWFMFEKEKAWEICDKATRQRGRLVKMVSINDFNHVSLMAGREKRFMKILGDSAHLAQDLYPQLVDVNVMINIPRVMLFMITLAKKIMPKRAFAKMRVCPADTLKDDISKCPYVRQMIPVEDIPTFLGGKCDCPGGCIPSVPNSASKPLGPEDADK